MARTTPIDPRWEALVRLALMGLLTEEQSRELAAFDSQLVAAAFRAMVQRIADQNRSLAERHAQLHPPPPTLPPDPAASPAVGPHTPSGQIPPYQKPAPTKRPRKPGARKGHPGSRRQTPEHIDERKTHRLKRCPKCGGNLQRCQRTRTRIIIDIPELIEPVATEHTLHRDFCQKCRDHVEPVVPDALPSAQLGHRLVCLSAWFHYGLGITTRTVADLLQHPLNLSVTAGGLHHAWQRVAAILTGWYEELAEQARTSAVLHADETGWRVNGVTHWLWCFASKKLVYFHVDRTRGSPVLQAFFRDAFRGTLVTDFYAAYEAVCADDRQMCLSHLLRELEAVDARNVSQEWKDFSKRLLRLLRDGMRLRRRPDFAPDRWARRIQLIDQRLCDLSLPEREDGSRVYADDDADRMARRLHRHRDRIFTFLDKPDVPPTNNDAERALRPAVIARKNIQGNRSATGAETQAVMMSIFRTLKLRGLDPTTTVVEALRAYMTTGTLPPLPADSLQTAE